MSIEETTPGYKTTEFWLSLAAIVVSAIIFVVSSLVDQGLVAEGSQSYAVMLIVLKIASAAATVLTSLGYTVARTMVKRQSLQLRMAKLEADAATDRDVRIARLNSEKQ